MFSESARIYDLVYQGAGKDYDAEAERVAELVRERLPDARTLLDVACGTGQHLARFAPWLTCTGVDLNAGLLAAVRERCPDADLLIGDMRYFDVGRRFDVVTCLFSSVGYMLTVEDLHAAVARMAAHLRPGGLLLLELALGPERWSTDFIGTVVAEHPDVSVVRMGSSTRTGRIAHLDLHYLVGTPDEGITHRVEHHDLGLFTESEQRAAVAAAGLDTDVVAGSPTMQRIVVGVAPDRESASGLSTGRAVVA